MAIFRSKVQPFITDVAVSSTPENCHGEHNGTIALSATAGGGQVAFTIDGGATFRFDGFFDKLGTGTYNTVIRVVGIPNLCAVTDTVTIANNRNLATLNGLNNLDSVGRSYLMYYNFKLAHCCAIDTLLMEGGINGATSIFFNKTGSHRNSAAAIMAACPLSSPLIVGGGGNGIGLQRLHPRRADAGVPQPCLHHILFLHRSQEGVSKIKFLEFTPISSPNDVVAAIPQMKLSQRDDTFFRCQQPEDFTYSPHLAMILSFFNPLKIDGWLGFAPKP